MDRLEELYINNTDIDSGVEYLPTSISKVYYLAEERSESRVKIIAQRLDLLVNKGQKK